ncbi:MAG: hypothetical protein ABIH39_06815 [Candidatus Margulisiibacteriota bacterium]
MTTWNIIPSPPATAAENMAIDWQMFNDTEAGLIGPSVRVYTWSEPGVTYGYLQEEESINAVIASEAKQSHTCHTDSSDERLLRFARNDISDAVSVPNPAKRPTGGGIVFHDTEEVAYCLAAPNNGEYLPPRLTDAYLMVSRIICQARRELGYHVELKNTGQGPGLRKNSRMLCFSNGEAHEIMLGEKKVVGSAQRRTNKTILQQGTVKVGILIEESCHAELVEV